MANWEDVRRLASALPQVSESPHFGSRAWKVKDKAFIWDRPLRKTDIKQLTDLGQEVWDGEILGARVENELAKEVLIADDPSVFFTIPHFNNYPAILVRLEVITARDLEEVVIEAWLDRAPAKLAERFLAERGA